MTKNQSALVSMFCFAGASICFALEGYTGLAWISAGLFLLSSVNLD